MLFWVNFFLFFTAISAYGSPSLTYPNTSLATVPVAYFGGNTKYRGQDNINMLAKMRIVMIEKWEGPCWAECMKDSSSSSCQPTCNVENYILDTFSRVKAVNPGVSTILYLNTLMDFPFYTLHGLFEAADANTRDSITGDVITIRNDGGMENITIYGFDTDAGVNLYIDAVKNFTRTKLVDGFFGDKWSKGAELNETTGEWQICNHECGTVSEHQAHRWNAGKAKVLAAVTEYVGNGPYFSYEPDFMGVGSNLNGYWKNDALLFNPQGDPRKGIEDVKSHQANHSYTYISCTSDQPWSHDPDSSLSSQCSEDVLARFLLAVEEGTFLGLSCTKTAKKYKI